MEEDYVSESFGLYEDQELIDALGMGRTPGQSLAPLVSPEVADADTVATPVVRGVAGGVRDAMQGFFDFTGEAGEFLQDKMPLGYVIFQDGNLEFSSQRPENMSEIKLPEIESGSTISEGLIRGLSQFVTGMAISPIGKAGKPLQFVKRAAFAETLFDPEQGNLATLLKDLGADNEFVNLLDSKVDEDADAAERLKARLKQAATGTIEGAVLDGVVAAVRAARSDEGFKQTIKNYFTEAGKAADARLAADAGGTTLTMGFDPTKVVDKGLAKLAPNKVVKLDLQKNQKEAKPRDESSGHAADYVPAQFGPPAHKMNMKLDDEFNPDGYPTFSADVGDNYQNLKFFISSVRGSTEFDEEVAFYRKLFEIKDNPDAEITVYRASPTDDLRYGDLITPIKSDADYYVEQSKITRDDIIKAERKQRAKGDKPVDLRQEKNIRAMDSIMELFPDDTTPSKVFTYKVKAKDIRWDGNNGLIRWGYFPDGEVKPLDAVSKISLDDIKPGQTIYRYEKSEYSSPDTGAIFYSPDKSYAELYNTDSSLLKTSKVPDKFLDIRTNSGQEKAINWINKEIDKLEKAEIPRTSQDIKLAKQFVEQKDAQGISSSLANLNIIYSKQLNTKINPGLAEKKMMSSLDFDAMTIREAGRGGKEDFSIAFRENPSTKTVDKVETISKEKGQSNDTD